MAALCGTALTFSIFCHLNASHLFRASIAPAKSEAVRKCGVLKRQSSEIHCSTPQNMKGVTPIEVSEGWQWGWAEAGWRSAALCLWSFGDLLCRTVWLHKISRKEGAPLQQKRWGCDPQVLPAAGRMNNVLYLPCLISLVYLGYKVFRGKEDLSCWVRSKTDPPWSLAVTAIKKDNNIGS